jgi:uncharacterized protein YpiB (UPF0302 family)
MYSKDTSIGISSTTVEVFRIDKMNIQYEAMLGLTAELILDEAILNYKRDKLQGAIDEALASGNEQLFYELTQRLQELET